MTTGRGLVGRSSNCGAGAGGLKQAVCRRLAAPRASGNHQQGSGVKVVYSIKNAVLGWRGRGRRKETCALGASGVRAPGACRSPLLPLL